MRQILVFFLVFVQICAFFRVNGRVINLEQGDVCAKFCSGNSNVYKFEENKIYVYNFVSTHSTNSPNAEKESIQLELKGKAEISKLSACDFALKLTDITMTETLKVQSPESKEYKNFKALLEKYSLRFGFDDGKVNGVCQEKDDHDFAVNVKKGILSSLQVSLDFLDSPNYVIETDVSGECITEYTTKAEPPNFVVVSKTKAIAGCARKTKYFSVISGRLYEQPMESKSMALLDGTYSCEIKMKRSEGLKESTCQEVHQVKPFQTELTGAKIEITQKLTFDSVRNGKLDAPAPNTRSDLTLKHGEAEPLFMKMETESPKTVLQTLCQSKDDTISSKQAKLFLQLIKSLKYADYKTIKDLGSYVDSTDACKLNPIGIKQIFLDALSNVKSDDAFQFLLEDANAAQRIGLSVIQSATPAMISRLSKKIITSNSLFLTLSSMIRSYCDRTSGCMLNPDIISSVQKLLSYIGNDCKVKGQMERETMLFALRAIRNIGDLPDFESYLTTLRSCFKENPEDEEILVYSLESVQKFQCNKKIDAFLWEILNDVSYASELRIQSYLSLVRCPVRETFGKVVDHLQQEKSQQVGSFIWSHISNLLETGDRFRNDVRDSLQVFSQTINDLGSKFNLDFRTYSKNVEKTFQRGNAAAKFDSNIIFSSKSAIPSSLSTNITFDIYGRSINLFEFGLRAKGVHEKLFNYFQDVVKHENQQSDIVKMDKYQKKSDDKMQLSFYSRIMGKEIYFSPNVINDFTMRAFKLGKTPLQASLLLLDSTISVASISGFPVEIAVDAVASFQFQVSKAKLMMSDMEIGTKLNAAIQTTLSFQINGHCTKVGIQTDGSVSTDNNFGGRIKIQRTKDSIEISDYKFSFDNLQDNRKLFVLSNELSLIHGLKKVATVPKFETKIDKCTGTGLLEILGLKLCARFSTAPKINTILPNLKADITIEKFRGFDFQIKKEYDTKPVRKMKSLLISQSFTDSKEENFKLYFNRDMKQKQNLKFDMKQNFEFSLWKRNVYLKFDVENNAVTGSMKYGQREGTLTGKMETAGIFKTNLKIDMKGVKEDGTLIFEQEFTEEGPKITIKATRGGENPFTFQSKTSMKITKHKIYNYFNRLRHETSLTLPNDNKLSLIFEGSKANSPPLEIKGNLEAYWKTKDTNNFYINKKFSWTKETTMDVTFNNIKGQNYTLDIFSHMEVNGKVHKIRNVATYFRSEMSQTTDYLMDLKLAQFDETKNKKRFELKTRFGVDLFKKNKGQILWENSLYYPSVIIDQSFSAKANWILSKEGGFDINAEISVKRVVTMTFAHEWKDDKNVVTSLKLTSGPGVFLLHSELELTKVHVLRIEWPNNKIVLKSTIVTLTFAPFNSVVSHEVFMKDRLVANVKNTLRYSTENQELYYESTASTSANRLIYSIILENRFKNEAVKFGLSVDLKSRLKVKVPTQEIDSELNIVLALDSQKEMSFVNEISFKRGSTGGVYGYKALYGKHPTDTFDTKPVSNYAITILRGSVKDDIAIKFVYNIRSYLIDISLISPGYFNGFTQLKSMQTPETINKSLVMSVNFTTKPDWNFYFKETEAIVYKNYWDFISYKLSGEYGKSKDSKLTPYDVEFKLSRDSWKKFDVTLNINELLSLNQFQLSKVAFGFNYKLEQTSFKSNTLVKWQYLGNRVANYYELKVDGNTITKEGIKLTAVLNKDSSQTRLFELSADVSLPKPYLLISTFNFKASDKFVNVRFSFDINDWRVARSLKVEVATSYSMLQLFKWNSQFKRTASSVDSSATENNEIKFNMMSNNQKHSLELSRVMKEIIGDGLDRVSNIKWKTTFPYVKSGSLVYGILKKSSGNFNVYLNVIYDEKKKLDTKFLLSNQYKKMELLYESNFINSIKFATSYFLTLNPNKILFNLDWKINDRFLKVENFATTWNKVNTQLTTTTMGTIRSSAPMMKEIVMSREISVDLAKVLKTLKVSANVTANGKPFATGRIDLSKGIIKMRNSIKDVYDKFPIKLVDFELTYNFAALNDFMVDLKSTVDPIQKDSQFHISYFNKIQNESPKLIPAIGQALRYSKFIFKANNNDVYWETFISNDLKSGFIKARADVDFKGKKLLLEEASLQIEKIDKQSEGLYKGSISYKKDKYIFEYKTTGKLTRSFKMTATNKSSKPQIVEIAVDLATGSVVKIVIDNKFNFDMDLKSKQTDGKEINGKVKLTYLGELLLDANIESKFIWSDSKKSVVDFFKSLFKMETGISMDWKMDGKAGNNNGKVRIKYSREKSKQFPGGKRSEFSLDCSCQNGVVNMLVMLDRNFPKFELKRNVYFKRNNYILDTKALIKYVSMMDHYVKSDLLINDGKWFDVLHVYNKERAQTFFGSKTYQLGYSLQKSDYALTTFLYRNPDNYTISTNVFYIVKAVIKKLEIFPVGNSYFVTYKTWSVSVLRKEKLALEAKINLLDWDKPLILTGKLVDERGNNRVGLYLSGSSKFEMFRNFKSNLLIFYSNKFDELTLTLISELNKDLLHDVTFKWNTQNTPWVITLTYKGSNLIDGKLIIDKKNLKLTHKVVLSDSKYKTVKWESSSVWQVLSGLDIAIEHKTPNRKIKLGLAWLNQRKELEITWDKDKGQTLSVSYGRHHDKNKFQIQIPVRKFEIAFKPTIESEPYRGGVWTIESSGTGKSVTKDFKLTFDYSFTGLLTSSYQLTAKIKTNLIKKQINLFIKREVIISDSTLYGLNITVAFDGEQTPVFGLRGDLQQMSPVRYQSKIHVTNYDKFLTINLDLTLKSSEVTVGYTLTQTNKKDRKFLFQFIPYKKFILTNYRDLTIKLIRTTYQFGFKREIVLKIGSKGPDLEAFSTFNQSPFKYYGEINTKEKKIVIHLRPVGDMILGEIYKTTKEGKKVLMSLKINKDNNNIMTSKLYWRPDFIDNTKKVLFTVFHPERLKEVGVETYQTMDYQITDFVSGVKTDFVKNMDIGLSLEITKGIVNDLEKLPEVFAKSYENDDLYIKTILRSVYDYVSGLELPLKLTKIQNKMKASFDDLSNTLYRWFVEADAYAAIYEPIKRVVDKITYDRVKKCVSVLISVIEKVSSTWKMLISDIANRLGSLTEKLRSFTQSSKSFSEGLAKVFQGSKLNEMFVMCAEIRNKVLDALSKVMESNTIKTNLQYYKDSIDNIKEIIRIYRDMKQKATQYFQKTSLIAQLLKLSELMRSMKYKEALLNVFQPNETVIESNLDEAFVSIKFYVSPIFKPSFLLMKTIKSWLPIEAVYRLGGEKIGKKVLELFYRYEYLIFNYNSWKSLRKLLPPYKRAAWVMKGQNIVTFDSNSMKIGKGKCTYILAREFKVQSFDLLMRTSKDGSSTEFELLYIKKVVIKSNGLVEVNGKTLEYLPQMYSMKNRVLTIFRDENVITFKTSQGLTIKYRTDLDTLKVVIDGLWHGSVKGLLGTNDFDKQNDLSLPNGRITHDIGVLSKEWSIGQCDSGTKTGLYAIRVDQFQHKKCVDTFSRNSLSYLSRCFSVVDPEPYFELCSMTLQYGKMSKEEFKKLICDLSRNYVMKCNYKGIMLRLDKNCVTCGSTPLNSRVAEIIPENFHYIFIMEQGNCLNKYQSFINGLVKVMSTNSKTSFSLLSFGTEGQFERLHFKAYQNKVVMSGNEFRLAMDQRFKEDYHGIMKEKTEKIEIGEAISEAIKMTDTPGYLKKIIVLSCSTCQESKKYSYSILAAFIKSSGTTLTYLTTKAFIGEEANADTVGFGQGLVYYYEKDNVKSKTSNRKVQPPADVCTALADHVWSFKAMSSENKLRRAAEKVHEKIGTLKGKSKQQCFCSASKADYGKVECKMRKQ